MNTGLVGFVGNGLRVAGNFLVKNSPTILTALSVGGVVTTVVMGVRATPKAIRLIGEEEERIFIEQRREGDITPLAWQDQVRLTWKLYIPTALMGATTIASIIAANSINLHRNAVLSYLYGLSETALIEYQKKVFEKIGEKSELSVRDEIAQEKLNANPVEKEAVIFTGNGDVLCYESLSGRYFRSSIERIRKIQNDFNHKLITNMSCYETVNDWYSDLGIETTALGWDMGWEPDHGLLDIIFSAKIATSGEPCIVISYRIPPGKLGA